MFSSVHVVLSIAENILHNILEIHLSVAILNQTVYAFYSLSHLGEQQSNEQ